MTHETIKNHPKTSALMIAITTVGAVFGIWAFTALFSVFAGMGWSVPEVIRQYMVATGAIGEYETLVDYYTHIKGFEYIIAVAFLGLYPVYYKYVNKIKAPLKA